MKDNLLKIYSRVNAMNKSSTVYASKSVVSSSAWRSFNNAMDQAFSQTNDDHFQELKLSPLARGNDIVRSEDYIANVHRAASYLHEQYVQEETYPPDRPGISNSPGIQLTQNQDVAQIQSTDITIEFNQSLQFVTEMLTKSEDNFEEGTLERNFVSKLKSVISAAKSTADIIKLIALTAAEFNLTAEALKKIFVG